MNKLWNKKVFTFMVLFLAAGMVGTAIFDGWQNKWCWLAMVLPYLYVVITIRNQWSNRRIEKTVIVPPFNENKQPSIRQHDLQRQQVVDV